MWRLAGGVLIGWGLGSNDAANIFGTGVAANVLKYRTAIILVSIFLIVGALMAAGLKELSLSTWLGLGAVALASINIFGGFIVTQRMLSMFKKKG